MRYSTLLAISAAEGSSIPGLLHDRFFAAYLAAYLAAGLSPLVWHSEQVFWNV